MSREFQDYIEKKHDYAREWKNRTGGKVVGYFCTYAPVEMFYAADILPVRIFGGHESSSLVEPHIYGSMYCPFCRDCLAQGLEGKYDYLDGIMISQCCIHIRQSFWSWETHIPTDYSFYLYMPHCIQTKGRYEYLTGELIRFKKSLEDWIGRKITDDDLGHGIDICNTNRRLMKQVYDFRKEDDPHITGLESLEMTLASQLIDKKEHSRKVKKLLKDLPQREANRETGTRLMLIGSETDDRDFFEMVESQLNLPATIVIEEHCTGSRDFWNEVIEDKERLMAIAYRYLDRPPCPSKDWPERLRFAHISRMVKDYGVEGVLLMQQKFCDPHELDIPALADFFKKELDIPTYFIEFDITVPAGQFSTRIEAFLETMVDLF
ncbi:MAG: 2-hydroxyacyl-CoA dehydratase [Thermodesulfobacteriota bacterium]|nr:2-hydroxyacyl-CoA dehydratase [Thermodesulfobacteriota bacterium]